MTKKLPPYDHTEGKIDGVELSVAEQRIYAAAFSHRCAGRAPDEESPRTRKHLARLYNKFASDAVRWFRIAMKK